MAPPYCKLCGKPVVEHTPGSQTLTSCMAAFMELKTKSQKGPVMSFVPSLNPASKTEYLPARVRATSSDALKFQGEGSMELSVSSTDKLTKWLTDNIKHELPSIAGTGVMYAACQIVAHDEKDPKCAGFTGPVRVQIKGPALNRDWGAEFVVDNPKLRSWCVQFAAHLQAQKGTGKAEVEPEEEKE